MAINYGRPGEYSKGMERPKILEVSGSVVLSSSGRLLSYFILLVPVLLPLLLPVQKTTTTTIAEGKVNSNFPPWFLATRSMCRPPPQLPTPTPAHALRVKVDAQLVAPTDVAVVLDLGIKVAVPQTIIPTRLGWRRMR